MPNASQRRQYFRIQYTPKNCPYFRFQARTVPVLDLAEESFRMEMGTTEGLKEQMEISGSMQFRDGETFLIHGSLQRILGSQVVVHLKGRIPLRKIMSEQILIIQKQKDAS